MKHLNFDYSMQIAYEKEVERCHYTIKCIPADTRCQKVRELCIDMMPQNPMEQGQDSFGNKMLYGSVDKPHTSFSFHIKGMVIVGIQPFDEYKEETILGNYKYPYGLTIPGEALRTYYDCLQTDIIGIHHPYDIGVFFMHRLYQDFTYEKNVTTIQTTAEEAWKQRKGVCQDYAHILIVLCRLAGIPSRYVAGMLEGEGFSHAWVEILTPDGWCALDPTNDMIVSDSHIKLSVGRDASDCMINRGIIIGGGRQTQDISVSVTQGRLT